MDVGSTYLQDHQQEERLVQLLAQHREAELLDRRSKWGLEAEVIMRRGLDVGRSFFCYSYLDRGMEQARVLIEREERQGSAFVNGGVIVARQMGKSRGRFDRVWHAPSGGAWLTLILSPGFLPENHPFYSLILGIACCEAIRHYGVEAHIKWVNDVHWQGRKLAGMLIEGYTSKTLGEEYLLLGIGVNVNNVLFPEDLRSTAVSLSEARGKEVPLKEFVALLLTKISWYLGLMACFEQKFLEGFYEPARPGNPLIEQWKVYSDTLGKRVLYGFNVYAEPLFEALAVDLDDRGALILHRETEGIVVTESSGEVVYLPA